MKYGKLIDDNIIPAPNPLTVGNSRVYNPTAEQYAARGWIPIVDTPYPEDDAYYTSYWEEQRGQIVLVWEETEPPEPEPAPPELTPEEKREQAYNTVPCIEWDGDLLTVTEAAQQWAYYAAEGRTDKTEALIKLIAAAKAEIRAQYPDVEVQA